MKSGNHNHITDPLQNIMSMVNVQLPSLKTSGCTEYHETEFIDDLLTEIPLLKQHLRLSQIELDAQAFRMLINLRQQAILMLIGSFLNHIDAQELCAPADPYSRLCHRACMELNDLLNSLTRQYSDSLLKETYVPEEYRILTAHQLFHGLPDLMQALRIYHADQTVVDLLMAPFSECISEGADITLARLNYLKLIKLQLLNIVREIPTIGTSIHDIMQIMFRGLNFNSLSAVQYCIRHLHERMQTLADIEAQREFLAFSRRNLHLLPQIGELALHPELPNLTSQLLTWITNEDELLTRTGQPVPYVDTLPIVGKMPIGMPNEHHALFTKIQIKAGGYPCKQAYAIRVVPQVFCAANGAAIGESAYKANFTHIEAAAVRGVLEYLEDLIHILKTDYGDYLDPEKKV
jgi:hypothetical protein